MMQGVDILKEICDWLSSDPAPFQSYSVGSLWLVNQVVH